MVAEFGHNSFHSCFVFLQQGTQLLILLQQRLVLDNDLCVRALEFGVKFLYCFELGPMSMN